MACWTGGRCIQLHPEQARELEGMSVAGESTIRMTSLHRRGGRVALVPEPALEKAQPEKRCETNLVHKSARHRNSGSLPHRNLS